MATLQTLQAKNFGKATISGAFDADDTTLFVETGHGLRLGTTPFRFLLYDAEYPDPADAYNAGKAELVDCTTRIGDTLFTVERGAEGTTPIASQDGHVYRAAVVISLAVARSTLRRVHDVRDYGAAGNGSTDDTDALNDAISDLPSAGGILYVPAGTYKVTGTVKFKGDMTIQGEGSGASIIKGASVGGALLQSVSPSTRYYNLVIRDLQVSNTSKGATGGIGIDLTKMTGCLVENVDVRDVETGIKVYSNAYYNSIIHPLLYRVGTGIHIESTNDIKVLLGKIIEPTVGILLENTSNVLVLSPSIEGGLDAPFSYGIKVGVTSACYGTQLICPRLENLAPPSGVGIVVGDNCTYTLVLMPYFVGLSKRLVGEAETMDDLPPTTVALAEGRLRAACQTFDDGDTTPSVQFGNVFYTNNSTSKTITDFHDGLPGQRITVVAGDANTTIQHGTPITTKSGSDIVLSAKGKTAEFVRQDNGDDTFTWREV